jgi:hypothetical protein
MVWAAAFRRSALSLEKAISIGGEVGRIGREKEQAGAGLFDRLTDAGYPVGGKIVHDDEVALPTPFDLGEVTRTLARVKPAMTR